MGRILFVVLLVTLPLVGCDRLDDERIPVAPVHVSFTTVADWNTYGIGGALDHRRFIKEERIPQNYPYSAISATGFGGVLLVGDVNGVPVAYDLACPVECKREVRISLDTDEMIGECPVCHSTYDIFSLGGHPLSGRAAEMGYGLRRYTVGPGGGGEYMLVSN